MTQDGNGRPLRIYVAGPILADTVEEMIVNSEIAQRVAYELICKGHIPFLPHTSVYLSYRDKLTWAEWMAYDDVWLQQCEALFYIGPSKGADIELARAKELGLQVFTNLDDVPDLRGGKESERD